MSPARRQVLVVDDEEYVRESVAAILQREGWTVLTAGTAEDALASAASTPLDAVVTDLKLPRADGLSIVERLAATSPGLPVIVLTAHGSVASAVTCMQAGAFDYLQKPADPDALVLAVGRALAWSRMHREVQVMREVARQDGGGLIGEGPAWQRVLTLVEAAAKVDSSVVLLGESGSGKEVVAREIHRRSLRADGPFLAVNCAAIPAELFESEFFGHVKGAFTGAATQREGRFRLAHGGTLMLDEVGCLPAPAQAKLLRVLQDGTFERVGDDRSVHVDVRVIAATNVDIDADAEAGRFRRDLLYRLDVLRIVLPPLRQRVEDIPLLVAEFLPRCARKARTSVKGISPAALRLLCAYPWPGNVRELQNVLERAVILERTDEVTAASLPFGQRLDAEAPPPAIVGDDLRLREAATRAERQVILEALRRADGVRADAARLLGIDPRNLAHYLRKHDIPAG